MRKSTKAKTSVASGPKTITKPLLSWYDKHARELPWRIAPKSNEKPDPYRIWLSEVMLQQTTVATVRPRFERFLSLWPTVNDLAAVPVEDVLAEWAGLGYYARARNLHKCACVVAKEHGGGFPNTEEELLRLPGIGPYTAAAIASIAFGRSAVVVDGNIERVMTRLFGEEKPIALNKEMLKAHAASLTPKKRAGDHAQALMDIGATICTPRNPVCALCPINQDCVAYAKGIAGDLPIKKKKAEKPVRKAHIYVAMTANGEVMVERRADKGLLGGMLGLPTSDWPKQGAPKYEPPFEANWEERGDIRHTFTHFHLDIRVWRVESRKKKSNQYQWTDQIESLPTVFAKALMI